MRTLKKGLILVLALALVLGVMAFNVSAFEDDEQNDYLEAVNVMSALGIIEGVGNDNFNPKGTLTRAQAAKIIAYMKQAQDIKATSTFEDTQGHWAESYVAYCNAQGIVVGVGEGKFNPNGTLKGYQFAKMLLCAVGYNDETEKMTGSDWEIGVAILLKSTGIANGIADFDGTQPLPRDQACELALRAMELYTRKFNAGTKVEGTDLLVTTGGYYSMTDGASLLAQYGVAKTTSRKGARDDFGAPVTRYSRAKSAKWSKISVVIPDEAVKTYTEGFSSSEITALKKAGITFADNVQILLNNVQMKDGEGNNLTPAKLAAMNLVGAEISLYTVDAAPGTIDLIVVKQSVLAEVLAVSKSAKVAANNVVKLAVYDNSDATPATIEYKDNDLETTSSMYDYLTADYAKGDFLQMWFEGGTVTAANLLDWDDVTKETAVVSSTKIAASGNTFAGTFSAGGTRTLASTYANYEKKGGKLTIGTEYELLLDSFGYVLGAVPVSAAPSPWSYAVYLDYHAASASGENAMTGEGATVAHERVKLFLSDGTVKIFDTAFTVDRNGNEIWKAEDALLHDVGDLVRYKLNASGKISVLEFSTQNETGLVNQTIPEKGTAFKVISSYANSKTVIFIVPNTATASNAAKQIKVYTGYNKIPKNVVYHAGNAFDDDYGTAMVLKTGEVVDVPEPVRSYAVLLGAPTVSASDEDGVLTYTYDAIVDGEETTVITLSDYGDPGFDTYALGEIETDSEGSSVFTTIARVGDGEVKTVETNFFDNGEARYVNKDTVYYRVTLNNGAVTGFEKVDALSESTDLITTSIYHVIGNGTTVDNPLKVVFFVEEVK